MMKEVPDYFKKYVRQLYGYDISWTRWMLRADVIVKGQSIQTYGWYRGYTNPMNKRRALNFKFRKMRLVLYEHAIASWPDMTEKDLKPLEIPHGVEVWHD